MNPEHDENFLCPYCGQYNDLLVDLSGGSTQEFVVDCETCCSPIAIRIKMSGEEILAIDVRKENE